MTRLLAAYTDKAVRIRAAAGDPRALDELIQRGLRADPRLLIEARKRRSICRNRGVA